MKIYFWYLLVLESYVIFSVKCLKFAPKLSLSLFQPFLAAILATLATVKVKLILDICSNKLIR